MHVENTCNSPAYICCSEAPKAWRIPEDCVLRCDESSGRRGVGGGDSADSLKWRAASASKLDWSLAANCSSLSPVASNMLV